MTHRGKPGKSDTKKRSNKKKWPFRLFALLFICLIAAAVYYYFAIYKEPSPPPNDQEVVMTQNLPEEAPKTGGLKEFSGEEFRNLYNNFAYPNTEYIAEDAVITGNAETDAHIREMAEKRGYVRRSAPVHDTFRELEPNMMLQERAAEPWNKLQKAAEADGINLFLTAAYRSADEQRKIFLEKTSAIGLSESLIQSGQYNAQLDEILATTAIPGYSRHHTGYTVDIGCGNQPAMAFEFTTCFDWLSEANYKNAKIFGWIPSYPEGAGKQGPEPETWEYVWVGEDAVSK